jgi:hypothetical protein
MIELLSLFYKNKTIYFLIDKDGELELDEKTFDTEFRDHSLTMSYIKYIKPDNHYLETLEYSSVGRFTESDQRDKSLSVKNINGKYVFLYMGKYIVHIQDVDMTPVIDEDNIDDYLGYKYDKTAKRYNVIPDEMRKTMLDPERAPDLIELLQDQIYIDEENSINEKMREILGNQIAEKKKNCPEELIDESKEDQLSDLCSMMGVLLESMGGITGEDGEDIFEDLVK